MLKAIRYTLAAIFLAASVSCLALWGWSLTNPTVLFSVQYRATQSTVGAQLYSGVMRCYYKPPSSGLKFFYSAHDTGVHPLEIFGAGVTSGPWFGHRGSMYWFPVWYPALVFALAGVAAIRTGQRLTVKSALIATTIFAVLLGMVVAL